MRHRGRGIRGPAGEGSAGGLPAGGDQTLIVGAARIEIHLPQSHSLKDKRQVLRSVKERLRSRYNVAVAEVDHQDLWQRASLAVATVAGDVGFVERVLDDAVRLVESEDRLRILEVQRQLA